MIATLDKSFRCSVALCTYRGTEFLPAQLESIAQQTRRPDELVVCDDASGDDTPRLVEHFASRVNFPVRLHINTRNLRSTRNFEQAFALCQGDWIVPSDQDDVWQPVKLAKLEAALLAHRECGFVFSDAECVDTQLNPLGYTLWNAVEYNAWRKQKVAREGLFSILLGRYLVTGATMAFRASFRDLLLPIPRDWVHDAWIAFLLSAIGEGHGIDEPLIQYRQHHTQQIGARPPTLWQYFKGAVSADQNYFRRQARMYHQALRRLTRQCRYTVPEARLNALQEKTRHHYLRFKLRSRGRGRRVPAVFREWQHGHYQQFAPHWLAVLQDLLV